MMACSLQTDTCQVSEWAARLESGATVKIQRNEEVTPSGYLKRALAHIVDGKAPHCHHGMGGKWSLRQTQRPVKGVG